MGTLSFTKALAAFVIILLILAVCTGCQSTGPAPIENPRQVWCDNNQPRRPALATVEQMTRPELDELNAYNNQGVDWCGWKF